MAMTINSAGDNEGRVSPEEGVSKRGLVLSYADCTHYLIGTTRDLPGNIVQADPFARTRSGCNIYGGPDAVLTSF